MTGQRDVDFYDAGRGDERERILAIVREECLRAAQSGCSAMHACDEIIRRVSREMES